MGSGGDNHRQPTALDYPAMKQIAEVYVQPFQMKTYINNGEYMQTLDNFYEQTTPLQMAIIISFQSGICRFGDIAFVSVWCNCYFHCTGFLVDCLSYSLVVESAKL